MASSEDLTHRFQRARLHTTPSPSHAVSPPILSKVANPTHNILDHSYSQVDEASKYVRDLMGHQDICFLDKPLKLTVPPLSFWGLMNDPDFESDRESRHLKISYDISKSVLTIFPMAGPRHALIIDWVYRLAIRAEQEFDTSIRHKIGTTSSEEFSEFEGEWDGSLKVPDFAITLKENVGEIGFHTVVEVGTSQSRSGLRETMNTYLTGAPQISRVVLVNFTEVPEYKSPKNFDINQLKSIERAEFQCDSNQGPLWYKGVKWVGYTTISWEVWERDPTSEEPKQIFEATIIPNDSGSRLPFFKIPTRIAADVEDVTIKPADIDDLWHHLLKDKTIAEAYRRIVKYKRETIRRADDSANIARQEDEANQKQQRDKEERAERAQRGRLRV